MYMHILTFNLPQSTYRYDLVYVEDINYAAFSRFKYISLFFNWHQITYFAGENVVISSDEILILWLLINFFWQLVYSMITYNILKFKSLLIIEGLYIHILGRTHSCCNWISCCSCKKNHNDNIIGFNCPFRYIRRWPIIKCELTNFGKVK